MKKTFTNNQINAGKILSTVRKYADNFYKENVPEFKVDKPEDFDSYYKSYVAIIQNDENLKNRFLNVFNDIILFEAYQQHIFDNEFSRRFKKPSDPLRRATFEAFVNPINPLQYDGEALERVLHLYKRDVKKQVYIRNREDILPVSINPEELMSAFQSPEAFMSFYTRQYKDLAHSNAIIEYNMIKQVINANYVSGALKYINIHGMTVAEINKMLKALIIKMSKPSSKYNNYINIEGATGEPVITNTPSDSMLFIPNAELLASLDADIIASAYNKSYAEVTNNIIPFDDFGFNVYNRENQTIEKYEESKIIGMLCDENIFKFTEHLNKQLEGTNIASLTNQTFYHIWQTIALRTWANCILLVDDGEEPTPSDTFKLIVPDESLTITNGEFSLNYEGVAPEDLSTNWNGYITLTQNKAGINLRNIDYTISSVDTVNKTVTFTLNGQTDGTLIDGTSCTIVISGSTFEVLTGVSVVALNIPVNYEPHLIQPKGSQQTISFSDTSSAKIVNLQNDLNCIAPSRVSSNPLTGLDISAFVTIYDETAETISQIDCVVNGTEVTIPAKALVDGAQLYVWLDSQTEGLNSSIVLFLAA